MGEYGDLFNSLVAGELRAHRARKKMTIVDLVMATGLSKSAILNYLNGKRHIPTPAMAEISRALEIEPHVVFKLASSALAPADYVLTPSNADYNSAAEASQEFP